MRQVTATNIDDAPSETTGDVEVKHLPSPIQQLQTHHARTMKSTEYDAHCPVFKKVAPVLLEVNQSDNALMRKNKLRRSKQQYMSDFVNRIWSMADDHYLEQLKTDPNVVLKSPVILFGDGSSSSMKGQRSTNPVAMLDYLKRFFTVLVINEHNSSQQCPKCWKQMEYLKGKGVRVKTCKNEACKSQPKPKKDGDPLPSKVDFIVNRDIAAPVNFISIAIGLVMAGKRPEPFECKKSSAEQVTGCKSNAKKRKREKQAKKPKRRRSKKASSSKAKEEPTTSQGGSITDRKHA